MPACVLALLSPGVDFDSEGPKSCPSIGVFSDLLYIGELV
jgi:hypothetical protein